MKSIILCGGLPRTGTTYFYARLCEALGPGTFVPEEPHFLADPRLSADLLGLLNNIYFGTLLEDAGRYSAWGSREKFVADASTLFSTLLVAMCGRSYIESATIPEAYVRNIDELRSNTIATLMIRKELAFKKPLIEQNWRAIKELFPSTRILYVVSLRDPFDIYKSLMRLGWIESYGDFVEMARVSFLSTIELLDEADVLLTDVFIDGGDLALTEIGRWLRRDGFVERLKGHSVDNLWVNSAPEGSWTPDRAEFESYFRVHPAYGSYIVLRERLFAQNERIISIQNS